MNIKRQYVLPNCNLVLEGLEDTDIENVDILDGQSPMSILINAECNFLTSNQTLSGGSVFLENLSRAVSRYAQEFLSGISQPPKDGGEYPHITITKTDNHLHRLILEPSASGDEERIELNLTTIELFDLVDAIDRFHADRTTLPSMTLELQSISKRYRKPEQSLSERLTPVGIGFASLAMAAAAFFVIPPPEIRRPENSPANNTTETNPNNTESASPIPNNDRENSPLQNTNENKDNP
ncbi:DUF4335 domain-containing protein [Waterburya agarophytonicola K14]|uniref:DUF4335 domain-containing protein n=1 Tax=Waterburya agarophytonicola KI4 TaxID=2874699 RepID=A0A964BN63_9CYAN|nr:DUF4335 domain-containing protein [Waterburya agarophytonicola]MCC0176509.1 DUF4335 domain-containing protein [Waterburya agarophytonicola KI4]